MENRSENRSWKVGIIVLVVLLLIALLIAIMISTVGTFFRRAQAEEQEQWRVLLRFEQRDDGSGEWQFQINFEADLLIIRDFDGSTMILNLEERTATIPVLPPEGSLEITNNPAVDPLWFGGFRIGKGNVFLSGPEAIWSLYSTKNTTLVAVLGRPFRGNLYSEILSAQALFGYEKVGVACFSPDQSGEWLLNLLLYWRDGRTSEYRGSMTKGGFFRIAFK